MSVISVFEKSEYTSKLENFSVRCGHFEMVRKSEMSRDKNFKQSR
jgi:hypothetical protein